MSGGAIAISPLDLIFKKSAARPVHVPQRVPAKAGKGIAEGSRLIGEGKLRVRWRPLIRCAR